MAQPGVTCDDTQAATTVVVGPVIVLAAVGLARAGRVGLVVLAVLAALWLGYRAPADKSNGAALGAQLGPLPPSTLVLSAQPEQLPLLAYYLGPARFASPLGESDDPLVVDWRDALDRLRAASPRHSLAPLVERLEPGQRLVLVVPRSAQRGWDAPWQREVLARAAELDRYAHASPQLRRLREVAPPPSERARTDVRATVFERVSG